MSYTLTSRTDVTTVVTIPGEPTTTSTTTTVHFGVEGEAPETAGASSTNCRFRPEAMVIRVTHSGGVKLETWHDGVSVRGPNLRKDGTRGAREGRRHYGLNAAGPNVPEYLTQAVKDVLRTIQEG